MEQYFESDIISSKVVNETIKNFKENDKASKEIILNASTFLETKIKNEKIISPHFDLNKTKTNKKLVGMFYWNLGNIYIFLGIISSFLTVVLCLIIFSFYEPKEICSTKECLRMASDLKSSMNLFADPCENFYEFVCGNWHENHQRPENVQIYSWFSEIRQKTDLKVKEFLNDKTVLKKNPSVALNKSHNLYDACMDLDLLDNIGFSAMFEYLEEMGLPRIPHFFTKINFNNETDEVDWIENMDWLKIAANIRRKTFKNVLIGIEIWPEEKNRSINHIYFGEPNYYSSLWVKEQEQARYEVRYFETELYDFIKTKRYLGNGEDLLGLVLDEEISKEFSSGSIKRYKYVDVLKRHVSEILQKIIEEEYNIESEKLFELRNTFKDAANQTIDFIWEMFKIGQNNHTYGKPLAINLTNDYYGKFSLEELHNLTDEYLYFNESMPNGFSNDFTENPWLIYIQNIFRNIDEIEIDESTKVYVSSLDLRYLGHLRPFLSKTSPEIIELYLWWSAIDTFLLHTTTEMRDLRIKLSRLLNGREVLKPRSTFCTEIVTYYMPYAASYPFFSKDFSINLRPKIEEMIFNIKTAFKNLISIADWMDEETKTNATKKADKMKSFIGFDEKLLDLNYIDQIYKNLKINSTTHFKNYLSILENLSVKRLSLLNKLNKPNWRISPLVINAFHTFQYNSISIPLGILQYPWYNLGLEVLNYGAIGTILGHEMMHGFDNFGRNYDKNGNRVTWWSNSTIEKYKNKTLCYVNQYNKYDYPELELHVNGWATLGENIADNEGFHEAFLAYKLYQELNPEEPYLPGMESFSHDQLFFISYGNVWCESITKLGIWLSLNDPHSPNKVRISAVLNNSPHFLKTFNCHKANSEKICSIW